MTDPLVTAAAIRERVAPTVLAPSDTVLDEYGAEFHETVIRYRGTPYAETERTVSIDSRGQAVLLLPDPVVVEVTEIAYDVGTAPDVEDIAVDDGYKLVRLPRGTCWPSGTRITLTYTHGHPIAELPMTLKRAAIEYACAVAKSDGSGQSRDVIAQTFDGGITRYSTPDFDRGRPTGWLEVDRLLNLIPDERIPGLA